MVEEELFACSPGHPIPVGSCIIHTIRKLAVLYHNVEMEGYGDDWQAGCLGSIDCSRTDPPDPSGGQPTPSNRGKVSAVRQQSLTSATTSRSEDNWGVIQESKLSSLVGDEVESERPHGALQSHLRCTAKRATGAQAHPHKHVKHREDGGKVCASAGSSPAGGRRERRPTGKLGSREGTGDQDSSDARTSLEGQTPRAVHAPAGLVGLAMSAVRSSPANVFARSEQTHPEEGCVDRTNTHGDTCETDYSTELLCQPRCGDSGHGGPDRDPDASFANNHALNFRQFYEDTPAGRAGRNPRHQWKGEGDTGCPHHWLPTSFYAVLWP
ncbi:hypothetical protein BKA93DRAFT_752212 [Sparassis latifolia]